MPCDSIVMRTAAYDTAESGDQFMINDDKIDFFQKFGGLLAFSNASILERKSAITGCIKGFWGISPYVANLSKKY